MFTFLTGCILILKHGTTRQPMSSTSNSIWSFLTTKRFLLLFTEWGRAKDRETFSTISLAMRRDISCKHTWGRLHYTYMCYLWVLKCNDYYKDVYFRIGDRRRFAHKPSNHYIPIQIAKFSFNSRTLSRGSSGRTDSLSHFLAWQTLLSQWPTRLNYLLWESVKSQILRPRWIMWHNMEHRNQTRSFPRSRPERNVWREIHI